MPVRRSSPSPSRPRPKPSSKAIDKLAERKLAEADQKVAKASLEQTLKFLAARDEALQSLEDLKKRLSDAPRQIEENQRELERLKKTKERPVSERYSGESAARLEMLLNDRTTQQAEWQKALGEANSLSITAETRPERAQAGISSMQARILEIGSLLKAGKESGKTINADRRGELLAEQAALTVQSQLLRQELAGNNLLQDLGKSQHDLLTEKISRLEKETLDLQALISEKRREQSEKTVAELSKEGAQGAGTDSLLSQENAKNLRLSDYLLRATDRLNVLTRRNLETKQQLDNLTQSNQALEEQITSCAAACCCRASSTSRNTALPKIKADQSLADEIADLRLGQFELNQERDKLATPQQYLDDLLAQQPSEQVTPELRKDLDTLLATRSELLERLNHELNALLNEAITLQLNQKQLLSTSESLRTTLDEQMFWIPSNQPLDLSWFKMTPTLLKNQLTEIPWGSGVRELGEGLVDRPLLFLPLFLLIAASCLSAPGRLLMAPVLTPITEFVQRYRWQALLLLGLISTYRLSDTVMGVMAGVFYIDMGFSKEVIASVSKVFGVLMTLIGAAAGGVLIARFSILSILFIGVPLRLPPTCCSPCSPSSARCTPRPCPAMT